MNLMRISLEWQDIRAACRYRDTKLFSTSESCPVFHALRRHGIPVELVGNDAFYVVGVGERALPMIAQIVTSMSARDWESISPFSFYVGKIECLNAVRSAETTSGSIGLST